VTDAELNARAAAIQADIRRMVESARRSIGQRARYGLSAVRRVTLPALVRARALGKRR